MTAADRINELLARGIELYLNEAWELRARCSPEASHILDAAKPMLKRHKQELFDELSRQAKGCYPCKECGRFLFHVPNLTCFRCRQNSNVPVVMS